LKIHGFGPLLLAGAVLVGGCGSQEAGDSPAAQAEAEMEAAPPSASAATAPGGGMAAGAASSPSPSLAGADQPPSAPSATPGPARPAAEDAQPSAPGSPPAAQAQVPEQPAATGTAANDVLERAEQAYADVRSMEADFTQRVYVPLLETTIDSRGKMYHRAPDRFLMQFSDPAGDVVVADGSYAWMYYPSNDPRQVMRAPLAQGGQQVDLQREFLSNASDRYTATRTGSETVGGRQTHALTLRPRGPSPYEEVRIWVDAENHLVRRFQITEANESVRTVELSNMRPNVTLDDSLFRFTPPPDAQVIEP
jgi:chaperone LolA